MEVKNAKGYGFMSSKLWVIPFIFVIGLTLTTSIPFILNNDFSAFVKSIFILQELMLDLFISGLLLLYANDFGLRVHLGCRVLNAYKAYNNIVVAICLASIIIKNLAIVFSDFGSGIYTVSQSCGLSCMFLYMSMINRVYLSDKIIHLGKYQKSINLDEIKSITLEGKNIEIIASSDRYVFVGTGEMVKEIETQIRQRVIV